jgi:hypothetical protein
LRKYVKAATQRSSSAAVPPSAAEKSRYRRKEGSERMNLPAQ